MMLATITAMSSRKTQSNSGQNMTNWTDPKNLTVTDANVVVERMYNALKRCLQSGPKPGVLH